MKKLILLFAVLATLWGCSSGVDTGKVVTMSGYIDTVSSNSNFGGTHVLSMPNGETVALESPSLNLSSSKYSDAEVEVVGKYNKKGVLVVSGVSVAKIVEECETEDEDCDTDSAKVGFEKYSNTDLGFTMTYPSGWTVVEGEDVSFYPPEYGDNNFNVDYFRVSQFEFEDSVQHAPGEAAKATLAALFERDFADYATNPDFPNPFVKVGPDSLDALVIGNTFGISYFMYRNGDGLIYDVSFVPAQLNSEADVDGGLENARKFEKSINSFKFLGYTVEDASSRDRDSDVEEEKASKVINSSDYNEEDYTSFESLPFHFAAKYPKDWYYAGSSKPGVLHHYGFSEESVTDENELISMDVISGDIKKGAKLNISNEAYRVYEANGRIGIYVSVGGTNYHISGQSKYEDIMTAIASSITSS